MSNAKTGVERWYPSTREPKKVEEAWREFDEVVRREASGELTPDHAWEDELGDSPGVLEAHDARNLE